MKKSLCTSLLTGGALLLVVSGCEPENLPPIVDAGPNQNILPPTNSVELKGSATDPDGSIVRYEWTKLSGPAAFTITHPDAALTRVEGLEDGWYEFQLRATDDDGLWATDAVVVIVGENEACLGCWDY